MPMHTETLSVGDWYELVDLDDETFVQLWIDGSDPVHVALEVDLPVSAATGAPLVEGSNLITIPEGKRCFVQLQSGTGDVIYSQFDGLEMDLTRVGFARYGDGGLDELWTEDTTVFVGFDDLNDYGGANPYLFQAFMETPAADLAASAGIQAAILSLYPLSNPLGRTLRVYGVAETTSQFSGLIDWSSMVALSKTTAFVDVVVDASPVLHVDVKTIIEELVDLGGWSESCPVQFVLQDPGSEDTGEDTRLLIDCTNRLTNLTVLLA